MSDLNREIQTVVLLVGAGPVGLTAACRLACHGMRVRIIDRKREPSIHSKALGVHARTLEPDNR
jgi:2-polyprenyl-6-methoxyphenol hydroxylase-like FAD-dependent oxidoreductase